MRRMTKGCVWIATVVSLWAAGAPVAWAQVTPPAPPLTNSQETQPAAIPQPAGEAERGYLGAVVDDREDRGRGVRIERLIAGGPAEKAGLRKGDLITGLAGIRVRQIADFAGILEQVAAGSTLTFEVLRGVKREKIEVTFGVRPGQPKPGPADAALRAPLDLVAPGTVSPPSRSQPPLQSPTLPASPKAAPPPSDERARIEMLERRLEQLERRLEQLERAISKQFAQ